ncbi:hypothetical protein ABPG72_009950 [Tetrahymena utriculariae]
MNPFFNNKFAQFPPQNSYGQYPPQQGFQQYPPQQGFQQYPPQQQEYQQYPLRIINNILLRIIPPPILNKVFMINILLLPNNLLTNLLHHNLIAYLNLLAKVTQAQCNNDHLNYTKDRLTQGKKLDQDKWLASQNQKFQAGIQDDGNLVVISQVNNQRICTFSSMNKTKGDAPHKLALNSNVSLEIQDYRNVRLWDSDTVNQGQGPYILIMQNYGNLVLFDRNKNTIWNTCTKSNNPVPDQPKCNNNHTNYTKDRLKQGSRLEQDKWLVSQNQKYYAGVQGEGNLSLQLYLVIYDQKKGDGSNYLSLDSNGVMKVSDKRNATLWDSDTLNQGIGPFTLIMQNDGNLSLFDRNERIAWCTNTARE